jgi:hypothetical protein
MMVRRYGDKVFVLCVFAGMLQLQVYIYRVIWNQAITIFRSWRNAITIRIF